MKNNKHIPQTSRFISHLSELALRHLTATADTALFGRCNSDLAQFAQLGEGPLFSFYRACLLNRMGKREEAEAIARELIDTSPPEIQARALLLLAGNCTLRDPGGALTLYQEASKRPSLDALSALTILKQQAVIASIDHDHIRALALLETAACLLRSIPQNHPLVIDFLNAVAVECTEVGQLDRARGLSRITSSSVWADRFPEWSETAADERLRERPVAVTVSREPAQLLMFRRRVNKSERKRIFRKKMQAYDVIDATEDEWKLDVVISIESAPAANVRIGQRVISGPSLEPVEKKLSLVREENRMQ